MPTFIDTDSSDIPAESSVLDRDRADSEIPLFFAGNIMGSLRIALLYIEGLSDHKIIEKPG
jgi:hypothetical protein